MPEVSGEEKGPLPVAWDWVGKDKWVEKTETKKGQFITHEVRQASVPKMDWAKERLNILGNQNRVKFGYVVLDTWYSRANWMKDIVPDWKKHLVCALKAHRSISFETSKASPKSKFGQSVSKVDMEPDRGSPVCVKAVPWTRYWIKKGGKTLRALRRDNIYSAGRQVKPVKTLTRLLQKEGHVKNGLAL